MLQESVFFLFLKCRIGFEISDLPIRADYRGPLYDPGLMAEGFSCAGEPLRQLAQMGSIAAVAAVAAVAGIEYGP